AWNVCNGAILPTGETCDGLDNNCNGVIDDGMDRDADGYTTCGTISGNCGGPTGVTGTMLSYVDCDDADPTRHPCQAQYCGSDKDFNCTGVINNCMPAPAPLCGDVGYYGGWIAASSRLKVQCMSAGNNYGTQCDTSTALCETADVQCPIAPV